MILLDTHVAVWLVLDSKRLSGPAASAIRGSRLNGALALSSISLWEMALLFQSGRVRAPGTVECAVRSVLEAGFNILPITPEIAALSAQFSSDYPRDPADRLIGATARAEGLTIVTKDERIQRCPLLKTIW